MILEGAINGIMANIITLCRMIGSVILLFLPVFSQWFYGMYILCGFTDMVDGIVARKTNTVSEFGSKLDSGADILFAAVAIFKLLPVLELPKGILIWVCLIAVIKIINVISGFVTRHKFIAVHSVLNKVTGMLLFLLPLSLTLVNTRCSAYIVCTIAMIAAIQEGYLVRTHCIEKKM